MQYAVLIITINETLVMSEEDPGGNNNKYILVNMLCDLEKSTQLVLSWNQKEVNVDGHLIQVMEQEGGQHGRSPHPGNGTRRRSTLTVTSSR